MTGPSPSLESVWRQAALATLQGGRRVDPPTESLLRSTEPDAAWAGIAGWPLTALDDRISRLFDCHHLAIALGDVTWLRRLHEAWSVAPRDIDQLRVLRATGEIGLGLGADGDRPHGWSAEESTTWWPRASCCRRRCPSAPGWRSRAVTSTRRGRQSRTPSAPAPGTADPMPAPPAWCWTWSCARSGPCHGSRRDEDGRVHVP